ncbi:MAG: hypothetical protein PHV59_05250 [Victivallales bacterium]|nr:hypothetical protein [Victivallales bacterium]
MKKNIYVTLLLICVIFLSGAIAGFFAGRMTANEGRRKPRKWLRSSAEMQEMFKKKICRHLNLNPEQEKIIAPKISVWLKKMDALRTKHAPQYEILFNEFYNEVSPVLSAEQKTELDRMRKKFTKNSPPPPPPPEPPAPPAPKSLLPNAQDNDNETGDL